MCSKEKNHHCHANRYSTLLCYAAAEARNYHNRQETTPEVNLHCTIDLSLSLKQLFQAAGVNFRPLPWRKNSKRGKQIQVIRR